MRLPFSSATRVCLMTASLLVSAVPAQAAIVTLQWDASSGSVQGYYVRYGTQAGVYSTEINVGTRLSHTLDLRPATRTTYYFVVQAFNAYGRSINSIEVSTVISPGATSAPTVTIDLPGSNAVLNRDLLVSGWSLDLASPSGTGVDTLHVYAYPNPGSGAAPYFLGVASYGTARQDLANANGARFLNTGYSLPVSGLSPGVYDIVVYAHSTVTNSFSAYSTRRVTISDSPPTNAGIVQLDSPAAHSTITSAIALRGWGIDRRSTSGPGMDQIQVLAYPNPGSGALPWFLGLATYGSSRQDVANAFGSTRFRNSGFTQDIAGLPPGAYDIVTLGRNTVNGGWEVARVRRVNVDPALRIGIDTPAEGASGTSGDMWLVGWAIDRRSTSGVGVNSIQVYAYPMGGGPPIFVGATAPHMERTDIAAAYGSRFLDSGYSVLITNLTPRNYNLAVVARSTVTGTWDNVSYKAINVR